MQYIYFSMNCQGRVFLGNRDFQIFPARGADFFVSRIKFFKKFHELRPRVFDRGRNLTFSPNLCIIVLEVAKATPKTEVTYNVQL